jgi:aminoglycoside phosphotransferase (APT) family kinase protein
MSKPSVFADLQLPGGLVLDTADSVPDAGTNSVYFCRGRFMQSDLECYLKVADRATQSIENERAILEHIHASAIPIPRVIAFGGAPKPYLLLSRLPGSMLWDLIDPRRSAYRKDEVLRNLQLYGATLARIHALDVDWSDQRRSNLEEPIAPEEGQDTRFRYLVDWLSVNRPTRIRRSFVHGDYNTGNVLIDGSQLGGVLDWEFAGLGWKEYEIAWALRARVAFLNSRAERDAILSGYLSCGHFEAEQLRWCEVLNYLHFARWTRETDPGYSEFALAHAESAAANVN